MLQPKRLVPKSLALRVTLISTVLVVGALIMVATVITALYDRSAQRNFNQLLSANLFNLIGAVGIDENNRLDGSPDFGDIRFSEPGSGWYWSVEPINESIEAPLSSGSLTSPIPSPSNSDVPFDDFFRRSYVTAGIAGERVRVFESEFDLGTKGAAARFRLMGNETEFQSDISHFRRQLWTYLAVLGLLMIGINALAMRYGLKPLDQVRLALSEVREGKKQKLEGRFPYEIEPLTEEMNALIESNRRIVERSRTQVGNLAHSLKTPLAVIMNEGSALGGEKARIFGEQSEAMRKQVEHYLQRARIAAQRESVIYRTNASAALHRLVRVVAKLNPEKTIEDDIPDDALLFAGEEHDLEEIAGNLLENAMKWSRSRARIRLSDEKNNRLIMVVDDDGPGIPQDKVGEALKRGLRLDEKTPGTGLGLSIVAELVGEYGGLLKLEKSDLGGLRVYLELPRAGN